MAVPCTTECGDLTLTEFLTLSESERSFLIYCAANALAPETEEEEG